MSEEESWETWNVSVWLANDENYYNAALYYAKRGNVNEFREWVEYQVIRIDNVTGIAKDFLRHSLGRVDWEEVMSAFVEEEDE